MVDSDVYSDKAIDIFTKDKVCQGSSVLYKYYTRGDVANFRKHLPATEKSYRLVDQVLTTVITDAIRDIILTIVGKLTVFLEPVGDLVVSGGEAFNTYFDKDDKVITSDIDTKFVPRFRPSDQRFFGYLQAIKLILWNKLGQTAMQYESQLYERVKKILQKSKIGIMFGIKVPSKNHNEAEPWTVTRRYTLIPKHRSSTVSPLVSPKNVLIDVELFALDMNITYYNVSLKRTDVHNIGGILDIAFMRPFELGYDIATSRERGLTYRNPLTGKIIYNKHILVASPLFLVDDLYLMKSLRLRPDKVKKDKQRLVTFAQKVLQVKNVTNRTPDGVLYKKALDSIITRRQSPRRRRQPVSDATKKYLIAAALKINPAKYTKYTTPSDVPRLVHNYLTPHSSSLSGSVKTSGTSRFNLNTHRWVKNTRTAYVKNEVTHRRSTASIGALGVLPKPVSIKNLPLYGFNPRRDRISNRRLFQKSAMIPFIRSYLKNTPYTLFKK